MTIDKFPQCLIFVKEYLTIFFEKRKKVFYLFNQRKL
jgi:hypothetical protein